MKLICNVNRSGLFSGVSSELKFDPGAPTLTERVYLVSMQPGQPLSIVDPDAARLAMTTGTVFALITRMDINTDDPFKPVGLVARISAISNGSGMGPTGEIWTVILDGLEQPGQLGQSRMAPWMIHVKTNLHLMKGRPISDPELIFRPNFDSFNFLVDQQGPRTSEWSLNVPIDQTDKVTLGTVTNTISMEDFSKTYYLVVTRDRLGNLETAVLDDFYRLRLFISKSGQNWINDFVVDYGLPVAMNQEGTDLYWLSWYKQANSQNLSLVFLKRQSSASVTERFVLYNDLTDVFPLFCGVPAVYEQRVLVQ